MLLVGGKAGNPWHGVWSTAGLALPNSTVMTLQNPPVGDAAACPDWFGLDDNVRGDAYPSFGDCFLVKRPGQPAVTTDSGEVVAGKTWLNYALFCGAKHSLYDVNIGRNSWVYFDSANEPWLAKFEQIATPRSDGKLYPTIKFSRGFKFGGTPEVHYFEAVTSAYLYVGPADLMVSDCSETGRRVTMLVYNKGAEQLGSIGVSFYLQGTPGINMASAAVPPVSFYSNSLPSGYSGLYYSGAGGSVYSKNDSGVGRIYDGDTPVRVSSGFELEYSSRFIDGTTRSPDGVDGRLFVETDFGVFNVSVEQTIYYTGLDVSDATTVLASYTWSGLRNGNTTYPSIKVLRRSNKVLEAVLYEDAPGGGYLPADQYHSLCFVLPDRFEATGYLIPKNNNDRHCSYHPVTRQLLESTTPVCFV